nr:hypothetical protein [Tanacetum cinerariifolium]
GEGSRTLTEPHHTPSPEAQQSPLHDSSLPLHLTTTTKIIPTVTPTDIPTLRQYSRRAARIAQSKALPTAAAKPASFIIDDSQGEAFPTVYGLEVGHDRENIIMTSALPHDSTPRVTSLDADEGNKDKGTIELSGDDAPIKGRSLEIGEEAGVKRSTERGSNDTKELVNVLTSLDAANILTSGVQAVSVSPAAKVFNVGVPTGSGLVPTVSAIFTTTSVVTPYSRRKGKEKMMKSDTPKKKKLQEQIDVQMAREMKEKMTREDQRMHKQIARDAKIARIDAEEELQMMIDGLDRNNNVIAKHLHEYEQSAADLTIGEKIELINELVKYQDHHAKILKYQAQQSKPLSKKEQREFYMSVLKSHSGWKTKHFRGMTLKEIREKFIPVWKQIKRLCAHGFKRKRKSKEERAELVPVEEVYVEALEVKLPIINWEIHTEGKRDYWKIIRLRGHTSVYQFFVDMLKQMDREDLNQLCTLIKETLSIRQALSNKEKELWVELKRLYETDFQDQMWTHTQALMHDQLEWKLYDTCGVHHVFTRDQEIFMLVGRDYPLRRGLAISKDKEMIEASSPDKAFDSRNLIEDEVSSLGEDCWE